MTPSYPRGLPTLWIGATMDIEVLRTSFESFQNGEWTFTERFYGILLSRHPQLRVLFGGEVRRKQQVMLYQALAAIMDHLDDAFWLRTALMRYGARHAEYGVTDEMYDWFGECLLATLAECKGRDWTPHLERAWFDAYKAISTLMKEGAANHESEAS